MNEQAKAATAVMEEWLSHPQELGKKPAKLEIAGTFDLHGLHYYIFKFKKSIFGSWKVAVCGGYEGDGVGHCGHICSEMEDYDPSTAQEKCAAMVEKIRQYWIDRANTQEEKNEKGNSAGKLLGFVLLSTPEFDVEAFCNAMKEDWEIEPEKPEEDETAIVFHVDGMLASVALMEAPVPNGEAEYWANSNFMTREKSIAASRAHKAHLMVIIMGLDSTPLNAGMLFAKVTSTCLKSSNALGIYTHGTVWLPEHYILGADGMKKGELPLMNLVFIGLYQDEKGVSSRTNGLGSFGKEELEILNSSHSPSEVYDMMWNISSYLIKEGAVLHDVETLGYSAEQKLPLTLSQGIHVDGPSMKIGF